MSDVLQQMKKAPAKGPNSYKSYKTNEPILTCGKTVSLPPVPPSQHELQPFEAV